MRDSLIKEKEQAVGSLAGQLLVAHPIIDDEMSKTIIFIESDDKKCLSGYILNQPLNILLKGLGPEFSTLSIGDTPVYYGGDVDKNFVSLTAWAMDPYKKTLNIYYDIDADDATKLSDQYDNIQFRAFLGHCEFSSAIRDEIERGFWLISSPKKLFGSDKHEEQLWKEILNKEDPNALLYFD